MASAKRSPNWTRAQQVRAIELYLRTPFGRIHSTNPDIVALATLIGRTPGAVAMKMSNFAALDPTIDRTGLKGYSKSDAALWAEFFAAPSTFIASLPPLEVSGTNPIYPEAGPVDGIFETREGSDIYRTTKVRKNQSYFRKMMLVSYEGRCAVTDIAQTELLIASHIKPWASDESARLNPRNGILLNSLHDRAFDKGFITFEDDLSLVVSKHLDVPDLAKPFFDSPSMRKPERFAPDPAFLAYHRDTVFESFLK